ncbi:hypothetical protein, partial [Nostoc sp. PCC 9305]|uniref:hypothetical protein n=1 Tax=Nostoc sp. PCC 9305 TaxID=296636 RepID=UPI0039C7442A
EMWEQGRCGSRGDVGAGEMWEQGRSCSIFPLLPAPCLSASCAQFPMPLIDMNETDCLRKQKQPIEE